MKQRLISALGGLVVLLVVLRYFDTQVLNVAISIISTLAVFEVLQATRYLEDRLLAVAALSFSALIPFFNTRLMLYVLPVICYIFIFTLFVVLLKHHETMRVEQVGFMFFICLIIPFSLTTAVYMRDRKGIAVGLFYTILALSASWTADTGAYFCGRFFGKTKLAPEISPKKTVEGAVGGAVVALFASVLISYLLVLILHRVLGVSLTVNYWVVALCSPFLTAASIIGDLSASIIKRQCGVKDFGHIMPGHGGVMDRFDSVLFVVPIVYILSSYLPFVATS